MAWPPNPEARQIYHAPVIEEYTLNQRSESETRQDNSYGDAADLKLDDLIQKVKHLCLTGAPQNVKDNVIKNIIKMSNSINEKYAIIDVCGLIEDNKVILCLCQ